MKKSEDMVKFHDHWHIPITIPTPYVIFSYEIPFSWFVILFVQDSGQNRSTSGDCCIICFENSVIRLCSDGVGLLLSSERLGNKRVSLCDQYHVGWMFTFDFDHRWLLSRLLASDWSQCFREALYIVYIINGNKSQRSTINIDSTSCNCQSQFIHRTTHLTYCSAKFWRGRVKVLSDLFLCYL